VAAKPRRRKQLAAARRRLRRVLSRWALRSEAPEAGAARPGVGLTWSLPGPTPDEGNAALYKVPTHLTSCQV
jgi:hypothetical protein